VSFEKVGFLPGERNGYALFPRTAPRRSTTAGVGMRPIQTIRRHLGHTTLVLLFCQIQGARTAPRGESAACPAAREKAADPKSGGPRYPAEFAGFWPGR
jgi:hypothetical protein